MHLYIKNIETGELIVVDTNVSDEVGNGEICGSEGHWSPDGSSIAFSSSSSNLVDDDTNNSCDVFIKNLVTGEIMRVSTDVDGNEITTESSYIPSGVLFTNRLFWSVDGNYVRFNTRARLLAEDTDNSPDWYGKNLDDGSLTLNPVGFLDSGEGPRQWSAFDPSGTLLAYTGDDLKLWLEENGVSRLIADNVFPNDINWTPDGSRIILAMPWGIGVFYP
jgi:Tol biopolymer transport system component